MAKKNNIVSLGKKSIVKNKRQPRKTITVKPKEEKVLTPEEQRDLKAKAKVNELLKDSEVLTLTQDEEIVDEIEIIEEPKGVEWLEEQIQVLSEQNEALLNELSILKAGGEFTPNNDAVTSVGSDEVAGNVIKLFNELQENHINLGKNFRIYCPGFLNRMIVFFPFLNEYKRYQ